MLLLQKGWWFFPVVWSRPIFGAVLSWSSFWAGLRLIMEVLLAGLVFRWVNELMTLS